MCVSVRLALLRDRHRAARGSRQPYSCVARVDHRWAATSFCHCYTLSVASFRSLLKVIESYNLAAG